jgi:hypothetical protein
MLVCPHCNATLIQNEDKLLTKESMAEVFGLTADKYSDKTKSLILKVLLVNERPTTLTALKFLSRINKFSDEQIQHGIGKFFTGEWHLKGYRWQWCAGMIERENQYKASQLKNKLSGIPREK